MPSTSNLDTLQDIRKIMERSSRFISLSGWSGIAAGLCALAGAFVAKQRIVVHGGSYSSSGQYPAAADCPSCLQNELIIIAVVVFMAAFITAVLFTWIKARKDGVSIWGRTTKRLLWNTLLPMLVGAIVIWRMIQLHQYDLITASSLVFYGLALVNGSKYTMGAVRYLGYAEILTGIIALWLPASALYAWAFGFGVLHIFYGVIMWWTYDRRNEA